MLRYSLLLTFIVLIQSCNLLTGTTDTMGSGTISVYVDSVYCEATNVGGREYFGYGGVGTIRGKKLVLELGNHPNTGDTLTLRHTTYFSDSAYASYDGIDAIFKSGLIVITQKIAPSDVSGNFYLDVVSGIDTLHFRNGHFHINFGTTD